MNSSWIVVAGLALLVVFGAVIAVVGVAMYLSAVYAYRSFKRLQGLDTTRLVTHGIYRWSRNPQSVGWVLVLVGMGLIRESAMVLVLAVGFWGAFRLYLPVEEQPLHRLFGDAYEVRPARQSLLSRPCRIVASVAPADHSPAMFDCCIRQPDDSLGATTYGRSLWQASDDRTKL